MTEKGGQEKERIEVRCSEEADPRARTVAMQLDQLLNGPVFEKMVRDAVEEMILEGKLTYDMETDEINDPLFIVKRWAAKMEEEVWSKK